MPDSLLSVDQARALILKSITPVSTEIIALDDAAGRVLSRDLHSPMDLPPFASSAMDGFAVAAADLETASPEQPVHLQVIGEVAAGHPASKAMSPGQAMAISTGAVLPRGADAVVPVEWVGVEGDQAAGASSTEIAISRGLVAGQFVRPSGQALAAGDLVLKAGTLIRPADLGIMAAIGQVEVEVRRRPRVAIFSSGDELVEPGEPLSKGKIYDSNRRTLAAALKQDGAETLRLAVAPDLREAVQSRLDEAVEWNPDLILSTAGVSVGEHDHVRPVVQANGDLSFWKVNIRPGKPIAFGRYRGIPFIGLPGNPVSMLVTYEIFVRPAIAGFAGLQESIYTIVEVYLREAVESDGRESYLRSIVQRSATRLEAALTGNQDSGMLSSLVKGNALLRIPAGVEFLPAGSRVEAYLMKPPIEVGAGS
ncbi:MAG: gephyrin-like molybdotransferase Glp [Anaerolineales bacterium]